MTFRSGLCGSAGLTAWKNHKKLKGYKFNWISKDVKELWWAEEGRLAKGRRPERPWGGWEQYERC